jgi:glycosyltransferase involved in cell wall biosynthesis
MENSRGYKLKMGRAMDNFKHILHRIPFFTKAWRWLYGIKTNLLRRFTKRHPERLYDLVVESDIQQFSKRALLSYLVHPFSIPGDDPRFLRHINIWRAREMVRVLNCMGYIVDVIDYRDTKFVPRKKYDLFIGHGGITTEKIARQLPAKTVKIYFSTGCYWKFHNEQELSRFTALRERRGVDLIPDRLIRNSEEGALLTADGVIGIGNEFTKSTYSAFSPVIMVNDTALFDDFFERSNKNFERGRGHFLYFAGGGNVHKGLDLLLEAFSELEQNLWICAQIDDQFADIYATELHTHPNIHSVGWIQPRSVQFYELMGICNFVILPSCSEGQASSIVECMNQGLIPIVSRASSFDVSDYGVLLEPCTIREIVKTVTLLSSQSAEWCEERAKRTREVAIREHSEQVFTAQMDEAIRSIILHSGKGAR